MKLLYHHRTTAQDGSAVHITGLVDALRQRGVEVIMAAPGPSSALAPLAAKSWLRSLRKRMPLWLHELAEVALNVPETLSLLLAISRHKPTVIYQRSNLYLLSGLWASRVMKIPLVSEVNAPYFRERSLHGGIAWPAIAERTEAAVWRGAEATIAVTEALADIVISKGALIERVHVMPNGVDCEAFGESAIDPNAKSRLGLDGWTVLGFTGYVREWNGLDFVLNLLATPAGRKCFLLVVGDGPARAGLEARAAELCVLDRIMFTGLVARNAIAAYVSAFDVALQPAANPYASPLKLFEYMALRRAIVAPDQANIREILQDGRDALLFEPGSSKQLSAAVIRLVADPHLRQRLADGASRTLVARKLTWTKNAEQVVNIANAISETGRWRSRA